MNEPNDTAEPELTIQYLNGVLKLFERRLKDELLAEQRTDAKRIAQAVFDQSIALYDREQESERKERKLKLGLDWNYRALAATLGFLVGFLFCASVSECSHLHDRLSSIESKQHS